VHESLAIRLAHLLHGVWSNIRLWHIERKMSVAQLCVPGRDVIDDLDMLLVCL